MDTKWLSPFEIKFSVSPDAAFRTPRARDKTPSVAVAVRLTLESLTLLHVIYGARARLRVRGGVKTVKDATRSI